jgi:hypothetical protein
MDALLHALNERMRNGGGIRVSRTASLSSSSSGGGSLGSPGSIMSQQHQVRHCNIACHLSSRLGPSMQTVPIWSTHLQIAVLDMRMTPVVNSAPGCVHRRGEAA